MLPPYPSPSPSPSPSTPAALRRPATSSPSVNFSPPLIAMVVVVAAAFVAITYSRLISRHLVLLHRRYRRHRRRRRLLRSYVPSPDVESPPYDPSDGFRISSPYGLDDSVIKSIPLSLYTRKSVGGAVPDCAVCLLEFEEKEYIRTLPMCRHAFHVDCIDVWLRSHPNCPLCRAGILFRPDSPFTPVMAGRIRPSMEDMLAFHAGVVLDPLAEFQPEAPGCHLAPEITQEPETYNPFERRDNFLLKRSYSFSFERSLGSERLAFEPAATSPWRYRKGGGGFWSKRTASPFMSKPRVFSFRYYRGMKSPFFRRRGGFYPLSERVPGGPGGGHSRRSKSMASPMFMRSAGVAMGPFSSSRMRSGDPEALLSPERFNRR